MSSIGSIHIRPAYQRGYAMDLDLVPIMDFNLLPGSGTCRPGLEWAPALHWPVREKVVVYRDLTVPLAQVSAPLDVMNKDFLLIQAARRNSVWPAIKKYQLGAAVEPVKLKAPVSTYVPITKVVDLWNVDSLPFLPWSRT